jgi:ABC-type Na+ transport system ATPase subunit NatA
MNLITGLVRPTAGSIRVLGIAPNDPEKLFKITGYSTQFDAFPRGLTGMELVSSYLRLAGYTDSESKRLASASIERVGLGPAADRKVAGYSKGMRQRVKLAQAIASPATNANAALLGNCRAKILVFKVKPSQTKPTPYCRYLYVEGNLYFRLGRIKQIFGR